MNDGIIQAEGLPEEIFSRPEVRAFTNRD